MGSGSWGTAFAMVLADAGTDVVLWGKRRRGRGRVNDVRTRTPTTTPASSCRRRSGPRPTRRRRSTAPTSSSSRSRRRCCATTSPAGAATLAADALLVSLMKGIELGTTMRMSEVDRRGRRRPGRAGRRRLGPEPRARDRPAAARGHRRGVHRRADHARLLQDSSPHAVLPAVHEPRRRRRRDRRGDQERHRARQRHGRGPGVRRQHAGLADHARAGRDRAARASPSAPTR